MPPESRTSARPETPTGSPPRPGTLSVEAKIARLSTARKTATPGAVRATPRAGPSWPARPTPVAASADRFLPDADLAAAELVLVAADPDVTYAAIDAADVSGDRLLGVLGGLTDLDKRLAGSAVRPKKLGELLGSELGFVPLANEP